MAGSIRLFVPDDLAPDVTIAASPGQAHYLGTVMRRGVGDPVCLFNGRDGEWQARLAAIRKDQASLTVETRLQPQAPEPDLWLAFAPLKRDPTDFLIQKATELGAAALLPVSTARTNTDRINAARLAAIATEAAEQCERLTVPTLATLRTLADLLGSWPADRPLYVAMERVAADPPPATGSSPAGLLIGPEGGFAPAELDAMRARPFVVPVTLGPRVLRAETAAVVGLALLQACPHR